MRDVKMLWIPEADDYHTESNGEDEGLVMLG